MAANLSTRLSRWRAPAWMLILATAAACSDAAGRPPAPAGSGPAAAPPSAAGQEGVSVRGLAGHYDLGDYFITGEVVNGLDVPIYDVELEVVYRGADGQELAREDAAVVLTRIEPGGTAPFIDTRYAAPEGIAAREVKVTGFSRQARLDYRPLTITGVQSRAGITGAVVTGQARNDAGFPLTSIKLVTSFRNAAGEVTGVFFDYPVRGTMAAGATVDFTVETIDDTVVGDRVTVQGEGHARR